MSTAAAAPSARLISTGSTAATSATTGSRDLTSERGRDLVVTSSATGSASVIGGATTIPAEDRTLSVPAETRVLVVPAKSRALTA